MADSIEANPMSVHHQSVIWRLAAERNSWRIDVYRKVTGGSVPPDYVFFWNRPFGRNSCILMAAVALAGLILPVASVPAQSDPQEGSESKLSVKNATWGFRGKQGLSPSNAIWGNRGKGKEGNKFIDDDEEFKSLASVSRKKLDTFLAKKMAADFDGMVDVIVKMDGPSNATREAGLAAFGGKIGNRLKSINGLSLKIPARMLDKLAKLPWALRISEDAQVSKCDEFTTKSSLADVAFASYGA